MNHKQLLGAVAAAVFLVLIGLFIFLQVRSNLPRISVPSQTINQQRVVASKNAITVQCVSADTNQPIEGVSLLFRLSNRGQESQRPEGVTGKEGTFNLSLPDEGGYYFTILARMDGYTHSRCAWADHRNDLFNRLPRTFTFHMCKGLSIGGVITDTAGTPIASATVQVIAPRNYNESGREHYILIGCSVKTDAQGQWKSGPIVISDPDKVELVVTPPGGEKKLFNVSQSLADLQANRHVLIFR